MKHALGRVEAFEKIGRNEAAPCQLLILCLLSTLQGLRRQYAVVSKHSDQAPFVILLVISEGIFVWSYPVILISPKELFVAVVIFEVRPVMLSEEYTVIEIFPNAPVVPVVTFSLIAERSLAS